ncbi:hypothetical protein HPP92_019320 [Vanilla planifolia]|uniref:Uncharacterized protein n=1 Tax=Vanilla planifolia TaxID=51239 RepID=A0A835Q2N6_VANPL|nr:hypothetical protein HPP92_019320 [Vanilla planifolia]
MRTHSIRINTTAALNTCSQLPEKVSSVAWKSFEAAKEASLVVFPLGSPLQISSVEAWLLLADRILHFGQLQSPPRNAGTDSRKSERSLRFLSPTICSFLRVVGFRTLCVEE